jgi:hypothetical protein
MKRRLVTVGKFNVGLAADEVSKSVNPARLFDNVCDFYELTRAQSWDLQLRLSEMGVDIER